MTGLDIFALIVLITIFACAMTVVIILGLLPGKIARERQHPNQEAIAIGSWLALIVGGVLWPLLLIWAYYKPKDQQLSDAHRKIAELEAQLQTETFGAKEQ